MVAGRGVRCPRGRLALQPPIPQQTDVVKAVENLFTATIGTMAIFGS